MVHPVQRHRRRQRHAAANCAMPATISQIRGWLWWRKVALPASFPITSPARSPPPADRGTPASWPNWRAGAIGPCTRMGLGAYITHATTDGDFRHVVLGIAVMSVLSWCSTACSGGRFTGYAETQIPADVRRRHGERQCSRSVAMCAGRSRGARGEELLVLDDVNLTLRQGEIVGLARPFRLRQIHAAAPDRRACAAARRQASPIWARPSKGPPRASPWCSRVSRCFPG